MSEQQWPNVIDTRAKAREQWEHQQQYKTGLFERLVTAAIPLGLFVIAAVFFTLSAQHTVDIFTIIFPGVGVIAPVGIELGIVYSAFMFAEAVFTNSRVSSTITLLRRLFLIIVVVANGAGSLIAVVKSAGLSDLSTQEIIGRFPTLPAIQQIALIIALLSAFAVPAAAVMSGEGFFRYLADQRRKRKTLDELWAEVRAQVEFEALRDAAINHGVTPGKASRWAAEIAQSGMRRPPGIVSSQTNETGETSGNIQGPKGETQKEQAARLLRENPAWKETSIDVLESQTGIDRSTWYRAKRSMNGHGRDEE